VTLISNNQLNAYHFLLVLRTYSIQSIWGWH